MWVDDEGVCHTVALPQPSELMSEGFRRDLDLLLRDESAEIADLLASEEEYFYVEQAEVPVSTLDEHDFEELPPPAALLTGSVETVDDLSERLRAVDRRWRLDALTALGDYCS